MRVLVCGGRDFDDWELLKTNLQNRLAGHPRNLTIIQGGAKGADFLSKVWAKWITYHGWSVEVEEYPAEWKKYGKSAGHIRNTQMLVEGKPDVVFAFPGGSGTENMIRQAEKANIQVLRITYDS